VSLKLPRPHSPSSKNLKTSFQLVMVSLSFVILIASLRDKRINSDSLSSFTKEGQKRQCTARIVDLTDSPGGRRV